MIDWNEWHAWAATLPPISNHNHIHFWREIDAQNTAAVCRHRSLRAGADATPTAADAPAPTAGRVRKHHLA
jgi:hypothetical protein